MKTININLIGDSGKKSKLNIKKAKTKKPSDARNEIFAYILLIGVIVVFAASFGGWLLVKKMSSNTNLKITKLNENIETLKEEEQELIEYRENLNKNKKIAEFKIVVLDRINTSFLPWSSVLKEISLKIPKDIIVNKIEKLNSSNNSKENAQEAIKLKISGIIPTRNKKLEPLTLISLFIFNINDNVSKPNSLLSKAKISKLEFDDKSRVYEFEIETSVNNEIKK